MGRGPADDRTRRRLLTLLTVAVPLVTGLAAARETPTPTSRDGAPTAVARPDDRALVDLVRRAARPLRGRPTDYDHLLAEIGDAETVFLGEATHGTHEFYRERARITRRLIERHGFAAMAIEGEWPDARRVHRWIAGEGDDPSADAALSAFDRFPRWMWANAEMRDLVRQLRARRPPARRAGDTAAVGFYGLDLQAPRRAAEDVVRHLRQVDVGAAERARRRYACVARLGEIVDGSVPAPAPSESCRRGLQAQWRELAARRQAARARGPRVREAAFSAAQNARVVLDAVTYFNPDPLGETSPWTIRDRHMADTLDAVRAHLRREGRPPKIVVWAHNTHVGDARASTLGSQGDLSVGQIVRERRPRSTVLIGFSTHGGSVVAASSWGGEGREQPLNPALPGSHAELFHRTGLGDFVLRLPSRGALSEALSEPRPERAVGVLYLPRSEATSHYLTARLARHFDVVVHVDRTRGVTPLRS